MFFYILFMLFFVGSCPLLAQEITPTRPGESQTIPLKDRISIRVNTVDLLLLTPSLALEFDLSNKDYGRWTLGLSGRFNPATSQRYVPSMVYNIAEGRMELRQYYRTQHRSQNEQNSTTQQSFFNKLEQATSRRRNNPRTWRAYYWGIYASTGNYAVKFGDEGKQGNQFGGGFSFGYGIPLYSYGKSVIDLEFGASVGLVATKYVRFTYDSEGRCYNLVNDSFKDWHLLPYPVVSDIRVAFVYRFASVKNKYKRVNTARIERLELRKADKKQRKDSISVARNALLEEREAIKKQLLIDKEAEKEKIRLNEGQENKDSLGLEKEKVKGRNKRKKADKTENKEGKLDEQTRTP
ncbi:MAG: DUF3575 domain-containing protein [Phocaeicola sp.]